MINQVLLFPYWLTLKVRHALYDSGVFKVNSCEVPSVCVGNITVGGTGKTPHTEMILDTLLRSDEWGMKNVAVLSRGHRRSSKGFQQVMRDGSAAFCGDEPLQIKKRFPVVTVAVDRNRTEGSRFLCHPELLLTEKKGKGCIDKAFPPSDIIVLDDAFQHRSLRAKVNIVLVSYDRPIYKDCLIPIGHLRDLPERLQKADVVIMSKCPGWMDDWERINCARRLGIRNYHPETCEGIKADGRSVKLFFTGITYGDLEPVFDEADRHFIYSKKLILFSGIAKDTPLQRYLSDRYQIVKSFRFPDHHKYSSLDIRRICGAAQASPTAVVVTTDKDSQRILDCKNVPDSLKARLFRIPIKVFFLTEGQRGLFEDTLLGLIRA